MDKAERVHYEQQVEQYIESNKLGDYFEQLTKQLVLKQPEDPVAFLINYLQQRRQQPVIFIVGAVAQKRNEIATAVANYMNFQKIALEELFASQSSGGLGVQDVSDDVINNSVYKAIQQVEKHYRGVVVSGYPTNFTQCVYIQHKGVLAERCYILNFSREQIADALRNGGNISGTAKQLDEVLTRTLASTQEVRQMYRGYYDEFAMGDKKKEEVLEVMKAHLKLKDQRVAPLRSPRVVLVTPPHLRHRASELFELLANKYGFHRIPVQAIINEHIEKKTEVGKFVHRNLRVGQPIPNDILTTLVRTEMTKSVAKHRGWIVEGFPKDKEQLSSFKSYKINPHLVIILDDDEENFLKQYRQLRIDPLYAQKYEEDAELDHNTTARLQPDNTPQEEWREVIAEYRAFVKEVEQNFENHTQRFRLSKETTEKMLKQIDVFITNPKIYS